MATFLRRSFLGVVWGVVWVLAIPMGSPAYARTLYVRQSGSDANDGLTPATALRTIAAGTLQAVSGDTIVVGPGTYPEGDLEPKGFVRIRGDRPGMLVGDPPGDVVVDATGFTTGFELNAKLAVTIDGFVVYGASVGIYVKSGSHQAVVSNNTICNNNTNGVYVQDSRNAVVFNNLVYNNGRTGVLVTGNTDGSPGARVLNNTVYRNLNRGIFFSGTPGSPRGLALNNIVQSNAVAGMQVNLTSRSGYVSAGNVVFDNRFASDTPVDVTDVEGDPLFIDPAGGDGTLGGIGYADDDFHLSEVRAGQFVTSPAVDAGSDLSRRFNLLRSTTRTDGRPDRGFVDAGYHYSNFSGPPGSPEQRIRFKKLYVSAATGDDASDGASRTTAVRTLNRAFKLARPGNSIVIMGGVYSEGQLTLSTSGIPGRPIVIKATNGARIIGSTGQTGILLNGVSHIVVDGLRISGAGESGIEVRNSFSQGTNADNILLRRVRLSGNGRRGLTVKNAAGVQLVGAVVENNGSRGVQVEGGAMSIDRSTIRGHAESGVWAFDGSSVAVSRTDLVGNQREGVLVEQSELSFYRGTVRGSTDGGVRFKAGSAGLLEQVDVLDNNDVGIQAISSIVSVVDGSARGNGIGLQAFVDPATMLPTEIAVDGTLVCENLGVGIDVQETVVSLTGVDLCTNGKEGLRQRGGSVDLVGGQVRSNLSGGVSATDGLRLAIDGTVVSLNQGTGIQTLRVIDVSVEDAVLQANSGDGIAIEESETAEIKGTVVDENGASGGLISGDTVATVVDSQLRANEGKGLVQKGGTLQFVDGEISLNGSGGVSATDATGLTLQNAAVDNNQGNGVQAVRVTTMLIEDSALHTNTGDGLTVLDSPAAEIHNNLVYRNGSSGIRISGDTVGSPDALVTFNTIYGNLNRGLFIGGSDLQPASTNAVVARNIFRGNRTAGIQVNRLSQVGYSGDFNLSTDEYPAGTPVGENDLLADPLLVDPDADDFHLSQTAAGQGASSPAVDAGGETAVANGMSAKTTRTDGVVDRGIVDLGYHYHP